MIAIGGVQIEKKYFYPESYHRKNSEMGGPCLLITCINLVRDAKNAR